MSVAQRRSYGLSMLCAAVLLWAACGPTVRAQEPEGPEDAATAVAVRDPLYRVEFKLPAPYWEYMDNKALSAQARGGCQPPQVPEDLLFVFAHRDAPAGGRLELVERSYLMRDRAALEDYMEARMAALSSQVGGVMQDVETSYKVEPGMITHRVAFSAAARGPGGCAPAKAAADAPLMRYVIEHHFVRPEGADALLFTMFSYAPADVFEGLKPEFDLILGSFRYTGETAAEFFAPDAPEDKLLTPADADKGTRKGSNWMLPVAMIFIVWMMFRRKKRKPE